MNIKMKQELQLNAYKIRKIALQTIQTAGSGHIGGSFSIAETLSVLYYSEMNVDPADPHKPGRDRLVLSKGHCSPVLYTTLAMKGFFPVEHLSTFRKIDSDLSGHVERHVPGVDMSTGSLGQGLSVALGMALYGKSKGLSYRTFCIMGDGEIEEGQVWEAAMAAGHFKADHLIAFVDHNKLQLDGPLEEVMSPNPIGNKFKEFGWNVLEVDGSDVEQIYDAVELASACKGKPTMIVLDTIKGKGVSVFENQVRFHGGHPNPDEFKIAYAELDAKITELGAK
jgi:transketolase